MVPFSNQSLSLIALQYELALLIGQDLRLVPMLRRFFPPTLKLLGCRAAHVWLRDEETGNLAHRFSYPGHDTRRLSEDGPLTEAVAFHSVAPEEAQVVNLGDEGWAHFLPLGERGFCVLVRSEDPLAHEIKAALSPIFDRLRTACAACIEHEQTEALRAQATLGEQKLRTVFETVGEVIFQLDDGGRVESLNPAWTRITGRPVAGSLGRRLTDLLNTDDDNAAELQRQLMTVTNENLAFNAQVNTPDGEIRHLSVQLKRARHSGGGASRLIGTMVDTTEQHRLVDRLVHARARAEEANNAKSAFLANMSHEIRTPMNGVIGLAQVALAETREPETRNQLAMILDSAEHLLTVINDILDFSRIEAGQIAFHETEFDLPALLADTLAQMRLPVEQKGLSLSLKTDQGLPHRVRGDAIRIKQVLLNLLGNACKFTSTGSITLRARPVDNELLRFEVEDTGIGIPAEKQQCIFDAFAQADNSIVRGYGGTGLGLTISRRLVELMNGEIGLESAPGAGSRFWFTARLECVKSPDTRVQTTAHPTPARRQARSDRHARLNILVAEDNLINRRLMEALLRQMGHNASFAENGQVAVASRSEREFDLVLMDMQMPVMDGLTATRAIRKYEALSGIRPVPVFALTANAMAVDREACLAAGMDGHLPKPLKRSALDAVLRDIERRSTPTTLQDRTDNEQ